MRKKTTTVKIGHVSLGGLSPIVIQFMTNTDTADINDTVDQIIKLSQAGSELFRVTINNYKSAKAIPYILEKLQKHIIATPIIGDFHSMDIYC